MTGFHVEGVADNRAALAVCRLGCESWRALTGTRPAALRAAAVHAELTHGDAALGRRLRERAARLEARNTPK